MSRGFILLLTLAALGLAGCLPRPPLLHVPDPHPTPLLTEAGDVHVTAGGLLLPDGGESLIEGSLQAAVSPVKHLGVFGLASYVSEPEHMHRYAEVGIVVYGQLGAVLQAEALAGRGWGEVEGEGTYSSISTSLETYTATAKLERLFVQGNAWWQRGRRQWGLSLRVSRARFVDLEGLREERHDLLRAIYLEPGFFFREGHGPLRVGMHAALSFPLAEPRHDSGGEVYRRRMFVLGFDVTLDLGDLLGTAAD